jgi:outer membrane protein TolC
VAGAALAQTNELLTWEQCLDLTDANNPDLVAARAAVRESEYSVISANSAFLPTLTASAGISYGQNESDPDWLDSKSSSGSLSLSEDLFSGGGNLAGRRRALAQLRIVNEQYRQVLADVELRSRLAFIDVLYAQDLIDLTEKIAERRANNVRLIQLRFDGGRENAGSLARSKAQLAQAEYEVRAATRALEYARRNLAAAIGLAEPMDGAAGDLQADAPEALSELRPLMEATPDYTIAAIQVEASRQSFKVTRSTRFPQIRFNASAGLGSGDYESYNGRWSMGVSADMPIYTGSRNRSEVAAAGERIIQTEMGLMDTANTLLATLQQQWNSYMDAVEIETTQKQLFDAEMLRAEISTAKYKQGLLSYEDWDIIESDVISQGKSYLQRRRSSEIEQARWKNALGGSVWDAKEGGYDEKSD